MKVERVGGGPQTPVPLRASLAARRVNVVAVAIAFAALASVLVHKTMRESDDPLEALYAAAAPTFVFGAAWAALLRLGGGLERTPLPLRIVASIVGVASATPFVVWWAQSSLFLGVQALAIPVFVAGVIAMVWVHHKKSTSAIAPDEQREAAIGMTAAALAAIALALLLLLPEEGCAYGNGIEAVGVVCTPHGTDARDSFGRDPIIVVSLARADAIAFACLLLLAVLGVAAGSAGSLLARRRENARYAFLRDVEAGSVDGYGVRVDDGRKVVVRITPPGEGYRLAALEEAIFHYAHDDA